MTMAPRCFSFFSKYLLHCLVMRLWVQFLSSAAYFLTTNLIFKSEDAVLFVFADSITDITDIANYASHQTNEQIEQKLCFLKSNE